MAGDEAKAGPKAVLDKLNELLGALGDVDGNDGAAADDKKPASEKAASVVADQVKAVRERYDSSVKWLVAAFVAVGLLLFGSLPFTNAVGADLFDGGPTGLLWGLLLAAVGIALVVWARTRALEPQDASLGELATTFQGVDGSVPNAFLGWFTPRKAAIRELAVTVAGDERAAHLGPDLQATSPKQAVLQLIETIACLEQQIFNNAAAVSQRDAVAKYLEGQLETLDKRMVLVLKDSKSVTGQPPMAGQSPVPGPTQADRVSAKWETLTSNYIGKLQTLYDLTVQDLETRRNLARDTAKLDVYLGHRDLVLAESAVSQMRGTFRLTRRFLILGGFLTLAGAAMYTSFLPDGDAPKTPSVVSASDVNTLALQGRERGIVFFPPTAELPANCKNKELPAVLLSTNAPGGGGGPFVAAVNPTDAALAECAGVVEVPAGQGRFTTSPR